MFCIFSLRSLFCMGGDQSYTKGLRSGCSNPRLARKFEPQAACFRLSLQFDYHMIHESVFDDDGLRQLVVPALPSTVP